MKKLLIIALLVVGCESFGVFKHEHDDVITMKQVLVEEKMYTEENNHAVTIFFDDVDEGTVVTLITTINKTTQFFKTLYYFINGEWRLLLLPILIKMLLLQWMMKI